MTAQESKKLYIQLKKGTKYAYKDGETEKNLNNNDVKRELYDKIGTVSNGREFEKDQVDGGDKDAKWSCNNRGKQMVETLLTLWENTRSHTPGD